MGVSERLETTDWDTLVSDMVDNGFEQEVAERSVDEFLVRYND